MSDLQIPAEAEAVAHAFGVSPLILADTAPFIVAAELRRLAEQERPADPADPYDDAEQAYGEGRNEVCASLLARANELDGGESS